MARFCSLYSGSSGNCTYIGSGASGVLIDAGVSAKRICEALTQRNIDIGTIKAIFVTHEHSDHIKGLAVLSKKINVPIIASADTLDAVSKAVNLPANAKLNEIDKSGIQIGDITACRFATRHDCKGSSGYYFIMPNGQKMSVCTDLGIVTDEVRNAVSGSDLILLESNHDLKMLKNGPYPPLLKMRIMSDDGHLSNGACDSELPGLLESGTTRFVLGHISRENNLQPLVISGAQDALLGVGAHNKEDYILKTAGICGTEMITI